VNADEIAQALGDARRVGRAWRCRCPLHGGRSLVVKDGLQQLLVTCWAGCDRRDVLNELRRRGLLAAKSQHAKAECRSLRATDGNRREDSKADSRRIARALAIWSEAQPGGGTIAEAYCATAGSRSILGRSPFAFIHAVRGREMMQVSFPHRCRRWSAWLSTFSVDPSRST
jgi:putative DNA primase/helicase